MSYAVRAIEGVKNGFAFLNPAQKDFAKRVHVSFERGHFTVKTISSRREFWQVMSLRYEVFHREFMGKKIPFGLDRDRFDGHADHLAIIDNRVNKIVGTYRLILGSVVEDFYSNTEFEIDDLIRRPGAKVELSRACIQKDYRNGAVITLLWRGIMEYLNAANARWLFGMGSVKTMDPTEITGVYRAFEENDQVDPSFKIIARPGYRIPEFFSLLSQTRSAADFQELVPPLLKSYVKAGAVIAGDPAIDRDFNCGDLFVIMDRERLSPAYSRKYQVH